MLPILLRRWRIIYKDGRNITKRKYGNINNFQSSAERAYRFVRPTSSVLSSHDLNPSNRKNYFDRRSFSSMIPQNTDNNSLEKTTTSTDGVVARPIDFDVASKVEGEESQIVTVTLEPDQVLRAESGAMLFMTQGVQMETTTGGGMSSGFKRMLTGQNLFISDFSYHGDKGTTGQVALGTDFPSKIIKLNVQEYGGKLVCQKGALLCASHTINIDMEFAKKMTAGFFGGEGFVLQSLTGEGDVFIKAGGTLIKKVLDEGEVLRVSSGSLVAFQEGVEFDVQTMPGFKNVVFGGEGLFVTTLTGPGTIWLQGMPPDRMINEIARRVPSGGLGMPIPMGIGAAGGGEGGEVAPSDTLEEDSDNTSETGSEEALAESETAIQGDRNAAVASSGFEGTGDPDSPSSLFGDAAAPETVSNNQEGNRQDNFGDETSFSNETDQFADFEDSTFSNENDQFADFEDKSFSTNDEAHQSEWSDFGEDETSFDTEQSSGLGSEDEDSGSSLLGTLWDLFSGDDD